jgi:hypothetical protein
MGSDWPVKFGYRKVRSVETAVQFTGRRRISLPPRYTRPIGEAEGLGVTTLTRVDWQIGQLTKCWQAFKN